MNWDTLSAGTDRAFAEGVAAALAGQSDHPVSRAIAQGLGPATLPVADFKALPGRGVQGDIGGVSHVLGNHRLMEERGQCSPALEATLKEHEDAGRTVTLLASPAGRTGAICRGRHHQALVALRLWRS